MTPVWQTTILSDIAFAGTAIMAVLGIVGNILNWVKSQRQQMQIDDHTSAIADLQKPKS